MPLGQATEEQVQNRIKAHVELAAKQRDIRERKLIIGDISIFRWDSMNWVVEQDNKPYFFSTLEGVFNSLLKYKLKKIDLESVQLIIDSINKAKEEIKEVIRFNKLKYD